MVSVDAVKIEPAEYEKYLRRAYKEAKFPKPRNFIGVQKDLPVEEMEKLMLTNTVVSDDDLIQLANQRGQAAKDFLTRSDGVAPERVFLIAPKLEAAKGDDKANGQPGGLRPQMRPAAAPGLSRPLITFGVYPMSQASPTLGVIGRGSRYASRARPFALRRGYARRFVAFRGAA